MILSLIGFFKRLIITITSIIFISALPGLCQANFEGSDMNFKKYQEQVDAKVGEVAKAHGINRVSIEWRNEGGKYQIALIKFDNKKGSIKFSNDELMKAGTTEFSNLILKKISEKFNLSGTDEPSPGNKRND